MSHIFNYYLVMNVIKLKYLLTVFHHINIMILSNKFKLVNMTKVKTMKTDIIKKPRGRPRKIVHNRNININTKKSSKKNHKIKNDNVVNKHVKVTKNFKNNHNKNFINYLFGSEIIKSAKCINDFNWDKYYIGALDAKERNTSNVLISLGVIKNSILLVEHDDKVSKSHYESGFCVHEGNLNNFSNDEYDEIYSDELSNWRNCKCLGWYFDLCKTIQTEKEGIINTINKTNLVNGSVLSFTFCRRWTKHYEYANDKNLFIQKVKNILNKKGFILKEVIDHYYRGTLILHKSKGMDMNTFMYTVVNM